MNPRTLHWLLEGDPSIRWQVLRDLAGAPPELVAGERQKIAVEGWGLQLLSYQDAAGRWGGQLYNHKWLSTTYTMLLLRRMGLEPGSPQAHLACRALLEGGFQPSGGIRFAKTVLTIDNAVTGMILSLLAYFGYPDERVHAIAGYLVSQQMMDGRWEPEPGNQVFRYAFDTTLLVLEGLWEYERRYPEQAHPAAAAQAQGREFLSSHRLYLDPQSGKVIDPKMLLFSFPPRWHYDLLAALDYYQACQAPRDVRLQEAVALLRAKQGKDGAWKLQNRHPGKTFFEMENPGQPSRWNTLRALRVLHWWEESDTGDQP